MFAVPFTNARFTLIDLAVEYINNVNQSKHVYLTSPFLQYFSIQHIQSPEHDRKLTSISPHPTLELKPTSSLRAESDIRRKHDCAA